MSNRTKANQARRVLKRILYPSGIRAVYVYCTAPYSYHIFSATAVENFIDEWQGVMYELTAARTFLQVLSLEKTFFVRVKNIRVKCFNGSV